jgi:hypothetical protein
MRLWYFPEVKRDVIIPENRSVVRLLILSDAVPKITRRTEEIKK